MKPGNGSTPPEVHIVSLGNNPEDQLLITTINIHDEDFSKRIWDDDVRIVEGGIDQDHVKIIIKSDDPHPRKYVPDIIARGLWFMDGKYYRVGYKIEP